MIGDDFITKTRKHGMFWLCRIDDEGVSHWSLTKYGAIKGAVMKAERVVRRRNVRRIKSGG